MSGSEASKLIPVKNSTWRKGFYVFFIVTALLFASVAINLELARQAALRLDQIWLTIYIQNSGLPFLFGTAMTAVVMGMIIVFASTQPHQKSQDY